MSRQRVGASAGRSASSRFGRRRRTWAGANAGQGRDVAAAACAASRTPRMGYEIRHSDYGYALIGTDRKAVEWPQRHEPEGDRVVAQDGAPAMNAGHRRRSFGCARRVPRAASRATAFTSRRGSGLQAVIVRRHPLHFALRWVAQDRAEQRLVYLRRSSTARSSRFRRSRFAGDGRRDVAVEVSGRQRPSLRGVLHAVAVLVSVVVGMPVRGVCARRPRRRGGRCSRSTASVMLGDERSVPPRYVVVPTVGC